MTNFKNLMLKTLVLILAVAVVFPSCSSDATSAMSGQWRSEYVPANSVVGTYAALNVYSTSTGEFYQLYANDGKWNKNPNVPNPPIEVATGDIRMQYIPPTLNQYSGLCIYSADTGEWKQYYLFKQEWKLNTNFPQPKVNLPGGDLRFDFVPGNANSLAGLNVFCAKTKQFEMFYLDGNTWKINEFFPTGKQI